MTEAKHTPGPHDRCCERVFGSGHGFRGSQRAKPPKVLHGGIWYCAIHDPERVAARRAKRAAKREAEAAENRKKWRLERAAPDMLEAHRENARLLKLVLHDLQGRVDSSKLGAISQCIDRSDSAIAKATGEA